MDKLDKLIEELPVAGIFFQRTYPFFKNHTAITNFTHVTLGIGIGFLIASGAYFVLGTILVVLTMLVHGYAFVKAG